MLNIGVLALQGSVIEHIKSLREIEDINAFEVRILEDLDKVDGLIIPGGESTTIGKLLRDFSLLDPIKRRAQQGTPLWGTCAGMILLAKEIVGEDSIHLGLMDIAVRRNAYGSQLDSFCTDIDILEVSKESIPLVFIRAPWVEKTWGQTDILGRLSQRIVAVRQGNLLATSFHPELTNDLSFHKYFIDMVKNRS